MNDPVSLGLLLLAVLLGVVVIVLVLVYQKDRRTQHSDITAVMVIRDTNLAAKGLTLDSEGYVTTLDTDTQNQLLT